MATKPTAKRPIDKSLIAISQAAATTDETVLFTASTACTIVGLRWSLSFSGNSTAQVVGHWAVIVVYDGYAANSLTTTDGSNFYEPEQNVLTFGCVTLADTDGAIPGPASHVSEGHTKTMRKMKVGDTLRLLSVANANTLNVKGVIQFFCKS